jgi:pimeloyl-ACP methyl ester carboxylesterase
MRSGEDVILLHGSPVTPDSVERLREHLVSHHRVFVPDMAMTGLPPDEAAEEMEEALYRAGAELAAVVAHSFGTYRAFQLALSERIRVTRIAALAPVAYYPDEVRQAHLEAADAIEAGAMDLDALTRSIAPSWASSHYLEQHPDFPNRMRGWFDEFGESGLVQSVRVENDIDDLRPKLSEVDVPVYIRVGAEDTSTPPSWAREIAEVLPNATLDVVDGVGHFIHEEDAEKTLEQIDEFLH